MIYYQNRVDHTSTLRIVSYGNSFREKPSQYRSMYIDNLEVIIWNIWEMVSETDAHECYSLEEIKVDIYQVKRYHTIVVTMPPPRAATEAYFVAIVFLTPTDTQHANDNLSFRYFTLELGLNPLGGIKTFFCEWTDKCHSNFGGGPNPEIDAFLKAVELKLDES